MKRFVILTFSIFSLIACDRRINVSEDKESVCDTIQWFVYNNPVNSYDVSVRAWYNPNPCTVCENCILTVYLNKGTMCYYVEIPTLAERYYDQTMSGDTVFIDNPTHSEGKLYFDRRLGVSFADVNFDGEEELIVCSNPKSCHDGQPSRHLDDGRYVIYKITEDSLIQIHNPIFDDLSMEHRNFFNHSLYMFDSEKQTLTLLDSIADVDVIKTVCWFKRGEPYKLDYTIEAKYWNGNFLYEPHIITYQFKLPQEGERFRHVMDSLWKCI